MADFKSKEIGFCLFFFYNLPRHTLLDKGMSYCHNKCALLGASQGEFVLPTCVWLPQVAHILLIFSFLKLTAILSFFEKKKKKDMNV